MAVPIIFEDRDEVLRLISQGDELIQYFTEHGAVKRCPLIFNNEKSSKFIAKGVQGSVSTFSLGIPGDLKEYVVKKAKNTNYKVTRHSVNLTDPRAFITLEGMAKQLDLRTPLPNRVPHELFFSINGGNKGAQLRKGNYFYKIENVGGPCKSKEFIVYDKWWFDTKWYDPKDKKYKIMSVETGNIFGYPKDSYLCESDSYTEYVIGLLCASLAEKGKCANFIDIFGFSLCAPMPKLGEQPLLYDYTFMEQIHGSVRKNLDTHKHYGEELIDSVIIQTIFALSSMQRILGIQHNDLHNDNVMFQDIYKVKDDVEFDGQDLKSADYFSYDVDDTKIYFKNLGVIAKIADFGFAMKYSEPILGPNYVANGKVSSIPPWRDDYYDLMFNMGDMYYSFRHKSKLVNLLFCTMFDPWFAADAIDTLEDAREASDYIIEKLYDLYYQNAGRPSFVGVSRHPWEYITDPAIMGKYLVPPPAGSKVVSLGSLSAGDYFHDFHNGDEKPLHLFDTKTIDAIYHPNIPKPLSPKFNTEKISDKTNDKYRDVLTNFLDQFTELEGSGDTKNIGNLLLDLNDFLLKRKGVWKNLTSGSERANSLLRIAKLAIETALKEFDMSKASRVMNASELREIDDLSDIIDNALKSKKSNTFKSIDLNSKNTDTPVSSKKSSNGKSVSSSKNRRSSKGKSSSSSIDSQDRFDKYINDNIDFILKSYAETGSTRDYIKNTTKFLLDLNEEPKIVRWLTMGKGQRLIPKVRKTFLLSDHMPDYQTVASDTHKRLVEAVLKLTE